MCACQNHALSWPLPATLRNEAPHLLFLGATKHQDTGVTTGTSVGGESQVAGEDWQGASLEYLGVGWDL